MRATKPLAQLKAGECARVYSICAASAVRRRFRDLGLIDGTKIKCVLIGSGGMSAYLIRGALIAIRCEDARKIIVY